MIGKRKSLVPTLFNEPFFPSWMRQFSLFDEDTGRELASKETSNLSLWEDENRIYVEAALPGLKPEEMEVTFDKGVLWVRGESKRHKEDENRKYYYKASNSFSYHIALPGNVSESAEPKADFDDGILKITFEKQQKEQPKKIDIQRK